jgi:hypothetical protein
MQNVAAGELWRDDLVAHRPLDPSTRRPPPTPLARPTLSLHSDPRGFAGRSRRWLLFRDLDGSARGSEPRPSLILRIGRGGMRARGSAAHAVSRPRPDRARQAPPPNGRPGYFSLLRGRG